MGLPREFFIEDRLERYRNEAFCNLGESGLKNFTLGEILEKLNISTSELHSISLKDSPNTGRYDLREEISSLYDNVNPEEVLITTGTSEALYLLFHYFINSNTKLTYFTPAFQALYEIPSQLGARINPINVLESIHIDKLFYDSNFIILNHPHNPTGKKLKDNDWKTLREYIKNFKGIILFDEHYRFLDLGKDIGRSGGGIGKNVFATGSITKSFGVTGLRIGWIIGEKEVLSKLRSFKDYLTHTVNPISEYLCLKLLQNKNTFLPPIKKRILDNSNIIKKFSKEFKTIENFTPPEAGIVCFPKLKKNISSSEYSDNLMKDCKIFVLPGSDFECEGYIRVGLGEESTIFEKGIQKWLEWEKN